MRSRQTSQLRSTSTLFFSCRCKRETDDSDASLGQRNISASSALPYRPRSSDPKTFRERAEFRRDLMYGHHRPLPEAPWRAIKNKTYLDEAERLYGRKETWSSRSDEINLKAKFVAILRDYLRDTLSAAKLEVKTATKYYRLCTSESSSYLSRVEGDPEVLMGWASNYVQRSHSVTEKENAGTESMPSVLLPLPEPSPQQVTEEDKIGVEERRQQGAMAHLEGTPATDGVSEDPFIGSASAFPFLRRRALERKETLDSSLVDWTRKYFPEDKMETLAEPPQLRHAMTSDPHSATVERNEAKGTNGDASPQRMENDQRTHARWRLQRSLKAHENANRGTYDAEGVYYHLHPPQDADDGAIIRRPRPLRGSDAFPREVVKVPWDVVTKSKKPGYTHDVLRAKERLIRLTRGEDPSSVP